MAESILLGGLLMLAGTLLYAVWYGSRALYGVEKVLGGIVGVVERLGTRSEQPPDTHRIQAVEERMLLLSAAIAEGITHVERVETRIRGTIKRATKEFAEHGFESPGLTAEAAELSIVDGEGEQPLPLSGVPADVAPDESSIPGVSLEQLRRVRGF